MFNKTVLKEVADILFRKDYSVAVAESVTAGLVQAAFASANNATVFFQGGITVYNARQKYKHLHVDLANAISCNCVSEVIATDMALAVSRSFSSDWGIAITGYASSLPGHDMNPLYAFYAISFKDEIVKAGEIMAEPAEPLQVQLAYVNSLLVHFLEQLKFREATA